MLIFGGELEVPAQVAHIHPTHNLVLLRYDPELVAGIPTNSAPLEANSFQPGQSHRIVGLDSELKIREQTGTLAEVEPLSLGPASPPRFHTANTEVLQYINGPTDYSGVVLNERQKVIALWQKFEQHTSNRTRSWQRGIDIRISQAFIEDVNDGRPWQELGTHWFPTTIAQANKLGLPEEWRIRLKDAQARPLELTRITHGTPASQKMQAGDLLLALNDHPVGSLIDFDLGTQAPVVTLTILRERQLKKLNLKTVARPYEDLQHIVFWAGALIQPPPLTLARQRQLPTDGVYVSFYRYGSPASRGGLVASLTITEVNGTTVSNMQEFAEVAAKLKDTGIVRVRARHLNQNPQLITLRLDPRYWPSYQLKRTTDGWVRSNLIQ